MLRTLGKIPTDVTVACSGGPDSMAILDFLMKGRKNVQVAYFNHDTPFGRHSAEWVHDYCSTLFEDSLKAPAYGRTNQARSPGVKTLPPGLGQFPNWPR